MSAPDRPEVFHDRIAADHAALRFATLAERLTRGLPKGRDYLVDQLLRASSSVVLDLAEGIGGVTPKEEARVYRMALRPATESAAVLALLERFRLGAPEGLPEARGRLHSLVKMLAALARSQETRRKE